MGKKVPIMYFMIIILFGGIISTNAQDVRTQLFGEVDKILQQAKDGKADILSPNNYVTGMEYYTDASDALKSGAGIDEVRQDVEKAIEAFKKADEIAALGRETFATLLKAREDAQVVNAHLIAPDLWEYGVDGFNSAAEELESGYVQDAKEIARESEKYFRDAELVAIKQKLLGPTWTLLEQADDQSVVDYAPVTLSKSKLLIQQAESELNDNRYNNTNAEKFADEANYEARHALYMTKLFKEMQGKDKTWEDLKLASEQPLKEIADKYNLVARFDDGYEQTKNNIINYVDEYTKGMEKLNAEKVALQSTIDQQKTDIDNYKASIAALEKEKSDLENRLDEIARAKQDFTSVKELFSISEAEVIKDGENIVLRLTSLNFDAGKAVIDPKYFSLLSKVQKAIELFPDCSVSVEGHTDSQGSDEVNLTLSQERADAVRQYLLANLEINSNKVVAIGYGETKPIANNETEDGRRANRRIDIVINPI